LRDGSVFKALRVLEEVRQLNCVKQSDSFPENFCGLWRRFQVEPKSV
jgi:hypothetical protein